MTPLMFAAQGGHTDTCKFLVQADVDFMYYELPDHKVSPLLLASMRGHVDIVRLLVSADFDLNLKDSKGRTVQQVISWEIQHRLLTSQTPLPHQNRQQETQKRRRINDNQYLDQIDGGDENGGYMKFVSIESYQKIVHMLKPHIQVELVQFSGRALTSVSITQETRSRESTVDDHCVDDQSRNNDNQVSTTADVAAPSKRPIFTERAVNSTAKKMVEKRSREIKSDEQAVATIAIAAVEVKAETHTLPFETTPSSTTGPEGMTLTTLNDAVYTVSTYATCITNIIATSIDISVPPSTQTEEEPTNDDENRGAVEIRTTKKSRISEENHNDDDDDSEPTLYKAEGNEDDTNMIAANIDGTSNTTVAKQDHVTQMSKVEKSFAPTIEAYLNQGRQTISAIGESTTTSSPTELKYLPRPEWCKPYYLLMVSSLRTMNKPYWGIFMWHDVATMRLNDYAAHLKHVVTNRQWHMDGHFYDDEIYDHNVTFNCNGLPDERDYDETSVSDSEDNTSDVHRAGDKANASIQEQIDFVDKQLDSSTTGIYFDAMNYRWKTNSDKRRNNTRKIGSDGTDIHDTSPSSIVNHSEIQITYKEMIQRLHYFMKLDGGDKNTLLLRAIEKNATDVAMDIIRIEFNTFKDYVNDEDYENNYRSHLDTEIRSFTSLQTPNKMGVTPLILAVQKGNMMIVQALLRCRISIFYASSKQYTSSALFQAAHFGRTQMMEYLIEYYRKKCYWECRLSGFIDFTNKNETTPLMRAAQEGHLSAVQLLLKNEADCNMQNKIGMSPLMFAAQRGHTEICQLLIQHGAKINATTDRDVNALLLACKRGHVAVVKALVTAGCALLHANNQELSIQQFIQRRIQKRNVRSVEIHIPRNFLLRRNLFEIQSGDDCDGRMNDDAHDDDNMFEISNSTDTKLLFLLHPYTQFQLIQRSSRVQRNFEIIRLHRLLQEERAGINFKDGSTSDIFSAVQRLTQFSHYYNGADTAKTMSTIDKQLPLPQQKAKQSCLPLTFTKQCMQTLLRTMLLPAPLVKMIALLLPPPNLWSKREDGLRSYESPNDTIVYALDLIDEILEEGGILSAFEKAQIPPPSPYRTWYDWKRSSRPNESYSDLDDEERWPLLYHNPLHIRRSSITTSSLPSFRDKSNPTLCELRRSVGYSSVLCQNQSLTDIVSILENAPYHMPRQIIDKLILIHDVASICRRCCTVTYRSTLMQNQTPPIVNFHVSTKYDIIALVRSLRRWYDVQTELNEAK